MVLQNIIKRDGRVVAFDKSRIVNAIERSALNYGGSHKYSIDEVEALANKVAGQVVEEIQYKEVVSVEDVQDVVERCLMVEDQVIAKEYILYRNERSKQRMMGTKVIQKVAEYMTKTDESSDSARENANIPANQPMAQMLKVGSEVTEYYFINKQIFPRFAELHRNNTFHRMNVAA